MTKFAQVLEVVVIGLIFSAFVFAADAIPVMTAKNAFAPQVNNVEAVSQFLSNEDAIAEGDVRYSESRKELVMAREASEEASAMSFDKWITDILNANAPVIGFGSAHARKGVRIVAHEKEAADKLAKRLDVLVKSKALPRDVFEDRSVIIGDESGLSSVDMMEFRVRFGSALRLSLTYPDAPTRAQLSFLSKEGQYLGGELQLRISEKTLMKRTSDVRILVNRWLSARYVSGVTVVVLTEQLPDEAQTATFSSLFLDRSKAAGRAKTAEVILKVVPRAISR